jgi:hypothetical protein
MLIHINYDDGGGKDDGRTGSKYVLSQTAKNMLLGALIATAGLWIFVMTMAMGYVMCRM